MKIGLIDTGDKSFSRLPHIGIACLAAYLRHHGYQVEILDLYFAGPEEQDHFFRSDLDLIGITSTSFSFKTCIETARRIKELNPGQTIVGGGPHVSVARREVLDVPELDYGIYGEGEMALLALAALLQEEKQPGPQRLKEIPNLIYRRGDEICITEPAPRIRDLDLLPFPSYEGFPLQNYSCYPLSTSRGCPYDCIYCASSAVIGRSWSARSPQSLLAEVLAAQKLYGFDNFYIIDDSFNLDQERVKKFCQLLVKNKVEISWGTCGFRADRSDPEMLALMKESGCNGVCVGIESANPEVLRRIGKGETIEQIRQGIERIHASGLHITGMFMIGNPGDTYKTVLNSLEFARSLPLDVVRFYLAIPYPETRLWDYVAQHGRFLQADYKNFHDFSDEPVFETDDFTAQERREAYRESLKIMFPEGLPAHLRLRPHQDQENTPTKSAGHAEEARITTRFAPQ